MAKRPALPEELDNDLLITILHKKIVEPSNLTRVKTLHLHVHVVSTGAGGVEAVVS